MKLTSEQMAALKSCNTAEEAVAKAAQAGIELSSEQAEKLLEKNEFEEITVSDLDAVSGGCGTGFCCYLCENSFDYESNHLISVGDHSISTSYPICDSCYEAHKGEWNIC